MQHSPACGDPGRCAGTLSPGDGASGERPTVAAGPATLFEGVRGRRPRAWRGGLEWFVRPCKQSGTGRGCLSAGVKGGETSAKRAKPQSQAINRAFGVAYELVSHQSSLALEAQMDGSDLQK